MITILKKLSNLIATFAAVFAVLARDSISAGIAGLSLSYAFNVKFTNLYEKRIIEIENSFLSIKRYLQH